MMLDPLFERIRDIAKRNPEKCAVICGAERMTYAEFIDQADGWLARLPTELGQSVTSLLPNGVELLTLMVATSRAGHNLQVLDPDWPAQQIDRALQLLHPETLIVGEGQGEAYATGHTIKDFWRRLEQQRCDFASPNLELPFYTGFTSGSTGAPKGFVRSQKSWLESFSSDQKLFQFEANDVFVIPGSLSHSLPLYGAIRGLYQGCTVYISPTFRPDRILRDCVQIEATVIYATPTQYRSLMDQSSRTKTTLTSVHKLLSAGSKFPSHWLADLKATFPIAKHYEFYGTSELSYVAAREMRSEDASTVVGRPMYNVSVRILDDVGELVDPNTVGHIFVKSPFLFMGYVGDDGAPDLSNCDFQEGYLSVGDTGYMDTEGVLNLVGRVDRMFQSSGRNIDPESIEAVLSVFDGVSKCAVFGVSDLKREMRIAAILNLDLDFKAAELIKLCREKLPKYMVPTQFYICEKWPVTHSYKTDYPALLKMIEAQKLRKL